MACKYTVRARLEFSVLISVINSSRCLMFPLRIPEQNTEVDKSAGGYLKKKKKRRGVLFYRQTEPITVKILLKNSVESEIFDRLNF